MSMSFFHDMGIENCACSCCDLIDHPTDIIPVFLFVHHLQMYRNKLYIIFDSGTEYKRQLTVHAQQTALPGKLYVVTSHYNSKALSTQYDSVIESDRCQFLTYTEFQQAGFCCCGFPPVQCKNIQPKPSLFSSIYIFVKKTGKWKIVMRKVFCVKVDEKRFEELANQVRRRDHKY